MFCRKRKADPASGRVRTVETDSTEQQLLVLDELSRQLADTMARQTNAVARGSIVVAAAGATSIALTATLTNAWMLVPITLGTVAAGLGFGALWLWRSKAALLTPELAEAFQVADAKALRRAFIRDRSAELTASREDLRRKNFVIRLALLATALSWIAVIMVTGLGALEIL